MNKIKEFLNRKFVKDRTIGFYIGLFSALLALMLSIIFYILVFNDRVLTSHEGLSPTLTVLLFIVGALSQLLVVFIDNKYVSPLIPIIPAIFCGAGLAIHLNLMTYPLADIFTGVQFFGGNANLFISFSILFGLCTIGLIVSTFMKQRKS